MTPPSDPVCPACGEAVGSTSRFCMHCDADFDAPIDAAEFAGTTASSTDDSSEWGVSDREVTDHPSGWDTDDPGDDAGAGDGHTQAWTPDGDGRAPTADTASTSANATSHADATPDNVADYGTTSEPSDDYGTTGEADSSDGSILGTLSRIGAVALTVVVGLVATFVLVLAFGERWQLWIPVALVGLAGIAVGGVVVYRQDSGLDALADALYVTAAALVLVPVSFVIFASESMTIADYVGLSLIFGLGGGVFALPVFLLGWWLQPDDE